ncbi:DUF7288 family protein [Haloarcula salina]|uniref:DUF7288 family protein n=1 Tax=Haloarcula salina TaxID=1429914 RepID=UPI003C6FCC6E
MRGQAHTLEAVIASLMLLSSLVFALQMTAVTPLSASTSSQHIENQQAATGKGVLTAAAEAGALKPALLFWNNSTRQFHGVTGQENFYTSGPPDNRFGEMLSRSFDDRGIAYNVYLSFVSPSGDIVPRRYVYNGVPTDNAVTATYTVTLSDDDPLYDEDGTANETTLGDPGSTYLIPDTGRNHYNTVRVEVIAWRI